MVAPVFYYLLQDSRNLALPPAFVTKLGSSKNSTSHNLSDSQWTVRLVSFTYRLGSFSQERR